MTAYLNSIYQNLPRLLGSIDTDPLSHTYGVTDRNYSAWKTIDFPNATNQGWAHGLARLIHAGKLPDFLSENTARSYIDALFTGTKTITRYNGSLEEACPFEGSYCVTALVAFDLLCAIELLHLQNKDDIVAPLIGFLNRQSETHAFISNHLATAAGAHIKWGLHTGDKQAITTGERIVTRILEKQSDEGWFLEYEGADPGYQSLCMYYLAEIYRVHPSPALKEALIKGTKFLTYFVHPDGSFGGYYGARNTRIYYPAAFEFLADLTPDAAAICSAMRASIEHQKTITLNTIDMPNFGPYFNAYCLAATLSKTKQPPSILPHKNKETFQKYFQQAGLLIHNTNTIYQVIALNKGGVVSQFGKDSVSRILDTGPILENKSRYYSIQAMRHNDIEISEDRIKITAQFHQILSGHPSILAFVILRILGLTLFQSLTLGRWFKDTVVHRLMLKKKAIPVYNTRVIDLTGEASIKDTQTGDIDKYHKITTKGPVKAIHMASSGYWERQDDP